MAITPWEMSKEPKELLPSAGSRRPSNSGSVPLDLNLLAPIKSAEPPSWGVGLYVLLQPPPPLLIPHFITFVASSHLFVSLDPLPGWD